MGDSINNAYEKLKSQAVSSIGSGLDRSKTYIQVGSATCENAAGSQSVYEEFRKHIVASGRSDIVLRRTGCTGRCRPKRHHFIYGG